MMGRPKTTNTRIYMQCVASFKTRVTFGSPTRSRTRTKEAYTRKPMGIAAKFYYALGKK